MSTTLCKRKMVFTRVMVLLASGSNGRATALRSFAYCAEAHSILGIHSPHYRLHDVEGKVPVWGIASGSFLPPLLITRGSRPANTYTVWFTISRKKLRKATRLIQENEEGGGLLISNPRKRVVASLLRRQRCVLHPSLHLFIL